MIVLVINIFAAQATRVDGQSMEPTLHTNERIIIEKVTYRLHPPERGDIIVLRRPTGAVEPLIKRVIGLPGETIEIKNGLVYIDGEPLDEPYLDQSTQGNMDPLVVPDKSVFVMGDNRHASNDSRAFGPVPYSDIVGRAWIRYWPLECLGDHSPLNAARLMRSPWPPHVGAAFCVLRFPLVRRALSGGDTAISLTAAAAAL
jgi:signal peptidase I